MQKAKLTAALAKLLRFKYKEEKTHEHTRSHFGIAGSLRRGSYNRAARRAATQLVPADATLDIFELDGLPGFNQDEEQHPPATVVELKQHIREADAVLIVTPESNYSVPGVLKNAIDGASRPYGDSAWHGKPAAIMGASVGTIGTARAMPLGVVVSGANANDGGQTDLPLT